MRHRDIVRGSSAIEMESFGAVGEMRFQEGDREIGLSDGEEMVRYRRLADRGLLGRVSISIVDDWERRFGFAGESSEDGEERRESLDRWYEVRLAELYGCMRHMLEHFRMSDWNSEEVQGLRAAWSRMVDELNDRILMEAAENEESELDIAEGRTSLEEYGAVIYEMYQEEEDLGDMGQVVDSVGTMWLTEVTEFKP